MERKIPNNPPVSVCSFKANLFSLVIFFTLLFFTVKNFPQVNAVNLTVICLLGTFAFLSIYDICVLGVHKRESSGLLQGWGKINLSRVLVKLVGLSGTVLIISACYYLNCQYLGATHLLAFFGFIKEAYVYIILLCVIYFILADMRQVNPKDEYWQVGNLFLGKTSEVKAPSIKHFIRVWIIKAFFIPYVFVILTRYVQILPLINFSELNFYGYFNVLLDFFYTIDVIFGVLGYVFTCRLLDTHIRSTDSTLLGWVVCLMCYGAFHSYFGIGVLNYNDGVYWNDWLADKSILYYVCGGMIILLSLIYAIATVALGYRMSNLTYRGIVTNGPYRFTKHPAYIGKVGSWWLLALPFLNAENPLNAIKYTAAMLGITLVYFLRAKTEENHLSNYPEYVKYADWINEHGLFSPIAKAFPIFKYSYEKTKKWKSTIGK